MRRVMGIAAVALVVLAVALLPGLTLTASAVHGGAPPAHQVDLVWHDGQLWNSVVLGELHGRAPAHTLDAFFMGLGENPVAGSGPGDTDYNGGRWLPTMVKWVGAGSQPVFTDGDEVEAAIAVGDLVVMGTGAPFLCPLTNPNDAA